ncbi:insulinase family protein [Paenibacillus turpanensis]|uniref:insulinase family protein n=1 Tax=Paenibacillus turpanensis TaxID=2689078 RepID=UPI00140CE427
MIKKTLSNGLRVVIEEIPSLRSVSFGIWVKNGSRNENERTSGISHFIEHMLFKGTDRFHAAEIADMFDSIGGHVNAFTAKEYTCYYAKVLDQHLPIAVDVLADMFFNSTFDPQELDKEKNVIIEEIAMYDDTPDDMVHDLISKAAYGQHPLAFSILGTEDNLLQMTSDDLRHFMKQRYFVENTVISLAGNVNESVLELLEQHFGQFHNSSLETPLLAPAYSPDLIVHGKKTEQNHICLALPGVAHDDPALYAMTLLNNAVGGGMSSRLFQEIREKRGLAYSIYSYHAAHVDSGMFTIYAGTAPKQTKEVLDVTMQVLSDIRNNGLTEAELKKGKEQLKGNFILGLESSTSRMNRNGKNELMLGYQYTLDELIAKIDGITSSDIKKVADQMFSKPFAVAAVGQSDEALSGFRRDQFVV